MPKASAQTSRPKSSAGDATRARLVAAAAALIVERGWGSVTTRAVAERAGVNQALVHYHFGSMDSLLREAVLARLEPEIQGLIDELLDDRPIPESIHRVMGLLDRFDLSSEAGVLMAEAMLQATRDQAVAAAMGGVIGSWAGMLEPRLKLAQGRGVIRADVDAAPLALLMAATLDGFLIQRMADPGIDATRTADTLIRLISPAQETSP
jgi:AcrR family transcriptional regulator